LSGRERREGGNKMEERRVRRNYLAVVVAAAACFLFEAVWYTVFLDVWLKGIGHDRLWLENTGVNPGLQYAAAFVAEALIAMAISSVTQFTGPQTAVRGMRVAAMMWLGFVLTTQGVELVFEVRSYSLFAVNAGFWLIGMVTMGAIVGGWKRKGSRE